MKLQKKHSLDILKIGVFLMGLSGLIISLIALSFYLKSLGYETPYKSDFYVYCSDKTVVINAFKDLQNVEVQNAKGKVFCSFAQIPADSDELCVVDNTGFYVVKVANKKKVVECVEHAYAIPEQVAID
jgi:hypothetical protein